MEHARHRQSVSSTQAWSTLDTGTEQTGYITINNQPFTSYILSGKDKNRRNSLVRAAT